MILLTSTGPTLRRSLRRGLNEQGEDVWPMLSGTSLELIMGACGCSAIVYVAGASMLEGQLEPRPSEDRARHVLRASALAGVKLVVAVTPSGENYEAEEALLRAGTAASVTLRCAPLVEEVRELPDARAQLHEWSRVTTGAMLSSTVLRALRDVSWQGRTVEVPTLQVDSAWLRARVATCPSFAPLEAAPVFTCVA